MAEKGLTRRSPAQDSHAYSLASTTLGQLPGLACLLEPPLGEKGTMEPSKVKAGQVVWYSQLLKNFPQFLVIHTVKGFGIFNKAEVDIFSETPLLFL